VHDLIVVGGGPAGSAAAYKARQSGLSVLVLERKVFPREKPCGGAVSERALEWIGEPLPPEVPVREIYGARVCYRDYVVERRNTDRMAVIVSRSELDHWLLQRAVEHGAEVEFGRKVVGYEEHGDHVRVFTEDDSFCARFLVVAEGCQGKLKRAVRGRETAAELGVCLTADIGPGDWKDCPDDLVDIHFGVAHFGYGWVFPHAKGFAVGIGGLARDIGDIRGKMSAFLEDRGFPSDHPVRGHQIPLGGVGGRPVATARVALAGDAAGFVDPFLGEGIAYAIRSGQLAADATAQALKGGSLESAGYARACKKEFGRDLRYALYLARLVHRWPGAFCTLLASRGEVVDAYFRVNSGMVSYGRFLAWLLPRTPLYLASALKS
jgi:geranylgeranyl reductase family protein